MRILLVDSSQQYPSNPIFAEALAGLVQERAWEYRFVDEASFLKRPGPSVFVRAAYRFLKMRPPGYRVFNQTLKTVSQEFRPDVVLVVKGAYIAAETLGHIRGETRAFMINYATDDPFNAAVSTRELLEGISSYDLYVCTKRAILADVRAAGCRRVTWVPFGYKPSVHFPEVPGSEEDRARFDADVVFVGGCDQDRVPFIRELVKRCPGIKVRLYGGYWDRCRDLRACYGGMVYGREYRFALGGSRLALNLVRRANRDGHVMRSFEVPACGVFMVAERTAEHHELFVEHEEMACFADPAELVDKVRYYLERPDECGRMRKAAYQKVVGGGHTYRDRLVQILAEAGVT